MNKITLDYFKSDVLPAIKGKSADEVKEKALAYLKEKAIEVVDEEGNVIDMNGTLVVGMSKAEDEPTDEEVKAEDTPAEEPEKEDDQEAMKRMIDEAVSKTLKAQAKEAPKRKSIILTAEAKSGNAIPATVKRYTPRHFVGKRNGMDADLRAYRFGSWALAGIAKSCPSFAGRFKNSVEYCDRYGLGTKAVHVETNNTLGGYAVPEEFGTDLIDLREQYGVARRIFKMRPMSSDTRTDPRRTGGLTTYFVGEGDQITESNKTWDQVRLTAKKLGVIARISNELSEDAVINIGDDLANEISYAFSQTEDDCAFNGTGTSTYGGIVGVRNALDDVDGSGTDSAGLITQNSGNTWAALTIGDFEAVQGVLPQYAAMRNPVWVASRAFYYNVMRRLELALGGVTVAESREGSDASRPTFLGSPVEISQIMPTATAVSTVACLYGAFDLGASFGDRRQESIVFSEHAYVNGQSVFERDEIAVRGTERFDINVHDVGDSSAAGPIVGLKTGA